MSQRSRLEIQLFRLQVNIILAEVLHIEANQRQNRRHLRPCLERFALDL